MYKAIVSPFSNIAKCTTSCMRRNRHVLDSQSAHHLASCMQQHNRGITYRKVWSGVLLNTTQSHFVTTVINSPRLIHRRCFDWNNRYLDHRLEMQQQQQPSRSFPSLTGRCWFATKAKKVGKQPKEIATPTPVMTRCDASGIRDIESTF
jgi:hypothetical protein